MNQNDLFKKEHEEIKSKKKEAQQNEFGVYLTEEGIPIINMSFSKADLFHDCPRKFFYKHVKKLEEPLVMVPTNPLICGSAVDRGLEAAIENNSVKKGQKVCEKYYTDVFSGVTEEHEVEICKCEIAVEKLYEFLKDMNVKNFELQKELKQEFELEDNGKRLVVSWLGFADAMSFNGIYDIKYTSNPKAYEDSAQIHLYAYLDDPTNEHKRERGGYICAKKTKTKKTENENFQNYADKLKKAIHVVFVPVKPSIEQGEAFVDNMHDIIFELFDENGVPNQDINSYEKLGTWCKNCHFIDICGGNPNRLF